LKKLDVYEQLSDWAFPPQSAQAAGDSEPVRMVDTAEGCSRL
jgi:hypothetical protein